MGSKENICLTCGHYTEKEHRLTGIFHRDCYEQIIEEENKLMQILQTSRVISEGFRALGGAYYSHKLGCECGGTPDLGRNYCGKLTEAFGRLSALVDEYDRIAKK